jgi:hypothetical protein
MNLRTIFKGIRTSHVRQEVKRRAYEKIKQKCLREIFENHNTNPILISGTPSRFWEMERLREEEQQQEEEDNGQFGVGA